MREKKEGEDLHQIIPVCIKEKSTARHPEKTGAGGRGKKGGGAYKNNGCQRKKGKPPIKEKSLATLLLLVERNFSVCDK